jgi:hypothetical protein
MDPRDILRWLFNPWVILGGIVIGIVLFGLVALLLLLIRSSAPLPTPAPPAVTVIAAPTPTPVLPTATPTAPVTPAPPIPPPPPEGVLGAGAFVQVSGTGGDGLRLRRTPGLAGEVLSLALEAEVFQISGGPEEVDGYTWWFLTAPADESRRGWAVSNYLAVVQRP